MSDDASGVTVLVVDDEETVADSFSLRLKRRYEVRTAYGGEHALELVDDDVDVVLLDRRMPDVSGDEVLATIRDRGIDCQVVMVTAVTPDVGVVEMPFDDYLVKPISGGADLEAIEAQVVLAEADDRVAELAAVTAKLELLEAYASASALEDSEAYGELTERAEQLRERVPADAEGMAHVG